MAKKYSKEIEELIVNNYNEGKTPYWMVNNIPELKGKRPSVIYGVLNRLGIEVRRKVSYTSDQNKNRRKYSVDDDFFEIIDTEEKAYWLGFMYADGYITCKNKIGLALSVKDIDALKKFNKSLNSTYPINIYTTSNKAPYGCNEYGRVLISSNKMHYDLKKHGVIENKTEKITAPNIDKSLIRHFIRGYFEGDGCITNGHKSNVGTIYYNLKIVGTKELLFFIQKQLNTSVKYISRFPDRNKNNYTITICGNKQLKRIYSYMYDNSTVYLDRKYNKFQELMNQ